MFVLHLNNFILDLHSKYYSMDVIIFPTNINSSQYIGIRTQDYDLNLINRIKTVPKAYWNPNKKSWIIPYTTDAWTQCKLLLQDHQLHILKDDVSVKKTEKAKVNLSPELQEEYNKFYTQLYVQRYSINTIKSYCNIFIYFLQECKEKSPESWQLEDLKNWIRGKLEKNRWSEAYQNSVVNALKFYYEKVRGETKSFWEIRARSPKKLPGTLSREDVSKLIKSCANEKHKLILCMIYSCGLRISEMINLRKKDIHYDQSRIFIKAGKGKKDRYVALPTKLINMLKTYTEQYKPDYWLIEGQESGKYSARSIQNVFHQHIEKAKVDAYATVHTLRHSYATHLIEGGVDIRYIQQALGHESLKTTEIYTHITDVNKYRMISPIDDMNI